MAEKGKTEMPLEPATKRTWLPWAIVGGVVVLLLLIVMGSYNGLVGKQETVDEKWANVETAYQRRADLVPNLVETVKGAANFEQKLLTDITEARASIGKAENPKTLQQAGVNLDSAIARLLVAVEAYPDLKASQAYRDLMVQLEGTENRIKVDRDEFNKAVKEYNVKVRRFPSNMIAKWFDFETRESFAAEEGAEKAPDVSFT